MEFEFNKTVIGPIVSILCLGVGAVTGHPIGTNLEEEIITWTVAVGGIAYSVWGVFKNHKKVKASQLVQLVPEVFNAITPIKQFENLTQPKQAVSEPVQPVPVQEPVQLASVQPEPVKVEGEVK